MDLRKKLPLPLRGGDLAVSGDRTRGGEEADEEDMLGRPLVESRLSPFRVTSDCRLEERDCDICWANCSGIAGLGGISVILPFKVVLDDDIEFLITDVAMSKTLGRLLRVPSEDCSLLDRGVPPDEGGLEMLDLEPCKPVVDFQDLRMDFLTPLLLSGPDDCEIDGGRCAG